MTIALRPFQTKLDYDINAAWASGAANVMPVAATGSGKTVILSKVLHDEPGSSVAIAHRQELVTQIATALARNGVRHRLVGAKKNSPLLRIINALQIAELGYSYYDPNAKTGVGGVDTIIRMDGNDDFFKQVRLGVQDEAHHVLRSNKWGQAASMFVNARWLLPTATPLRADGKGLGRHAEGLVDAMVFAPTMREIIDMGYLTDYRVFAPQSDVNLAKVEVSKTTGDFNADQLRKAVHESHIVGDVVAHYLKLAPGKLGVTFAVDVESATEIATAFRAANVPAEVVSAKTPDTLRQQILQRFKRREILQLCNVDLFGEGFDLPAVEVVSFARPTESWALFCQQFGRALRLMLTPDEYRNYDNLSDAGRRAVIAASGKPYAMIIDHVGNVLRHGLPDARRDMTLGLHNRDKRGNSTKDPDAIPTRVCVNTDVGGTGTVCAKTYERFHKCCPFCGYYPEPAARNAPEFVDGDLLEFDAETLAAMRGQIAKVDGDVILPYNATAEVAGAIKRRHWERRTAQHDLRNVIAWWAGLAQAQGRGESESYRRFYFKFGIDVANAQTLGAREAAELTERVKLELSKYGIDGNIDASTYFANKL